MTRIRRAIVRGLVALMIGLPVALVAVYLVNPFGARSLDPRQRIFGHGPYGIASSSMAPTLVEGQVVLVRAGHFSRHAPRRGDVAALHVPEYDGQTWVQRVIGLPGETISIRDGIVHVDGRAIAEPYVSPEHRVSERARTMAPVKVPPGQYFMMGDNRDNSLDSRWLPLTRREDLVGKVLGY